MNTRTLLFWSAFTLAGAAALIYAVRSGNCPLLLVVLVLSARAVPIVGGTER